MHCVACSAETPTAPCPECGEEPRLEGRYRLEALIGRGAVGTVYRAIDEESGDTLAIKEMPFRQALDPKRLDLLAREGRVLRQLKHPGIPRYRGEITAGRGRGRSLYLLQDFVPGRSLQAELEEHRYAEAEVLAILDELLGVLAYLHGLAPPVIHRDIKPSNVLRRPDGALALIDFGAVRDVLRDPRSGGSTVAGTFGFMAPEQFAGDASPATDLFGLAATAVALLSRRDPAQLHDRAGRFAWQEAVRVSPGAERLLAEMLHPDPALRLASAAAARARIALLRAAKPDLAPEPPRPEPERLASTPLPGPGTSPLSDAEGPPPARPLPALRLSEPRPFRVGEPHPPPEPVGPEALLQPPALADEMPASTPLSRVRRVAGIGLTALVGVIALITTLAAAIALLD